MTKFKATIDNFGSTKVGNLKLVLSIPKEERIKVINEIDKIQQVQGFIEVYIEKLPDKYNEMTTVEKLEHERSVKNRQLHAQFTELFELGIYPSSIKVKEKFKEKHEIPHISELDSEQLDDCIFKMKCAIEDRKSIIDQNESFEGKRE